MPKGVSPGILREPLNKLIHPGKEDQQGENFTTVAGDRDEKASKHKRHLLDPGQS